MASKGGFDMATLRQDALAMVQSLPEDQLLFIVNVMKDLARLMPVKDKEGSQEYNARERAFAVLESMKRKIPDLDYDKELAEYREEKYL